MKNLIELKLKNIKEIKKMIYNKKDTIRSMYDKAPNNTNEGCVAILKPDILKPEYRTCENQLFFLQGGFGCNPSGMGNACIGQFCIDGEQCREEKYNFLGIANEEITAIAMEMLNKIKSKEEKENND